MTKSSESAPVQGLWYKFEVWTSVWAFESLTWCHELWVRGIYLFSDDPAHFWIAVTQSIDCYSRCEIQVFPVLHIPEITSCSFDEHWWWTGICLDHIWSLLVDDRGCCRIFCRIWIGEFGGVLEGPMSRDHQLGDKCIHRLHFG